jgi:uncharacterized protein YqjF (DUF2071 family)
VLIDPEAIAATCGRPVARPVMLQGWHELASIHWRYEPEVVQAILPKGFRADTFDGSAWVGLLPFHMRRIRVPGLPPFGPLSTFPETNVRTYLVDPAGRRGVWFCSLDITRLVPALVARVTYNLPYCWAKMSIDRPPNAAAPASDPAGTWTYRSSRRWPSPRGAAADSAVSVRVGERIPDDEISDLEHFLSARWALGTTFAKRPVWAEVDHPPWPLHRAEVVACDQTLVTAAGLPMPTGEPVAMWSPGIEVRIGRPRRVSPGR